MKCTYLCAECSIIPNGQRDGVKSCLPPWTPIDFTGVSAKWMQGDKPAAQQENYPLQIRWAGVHPETPSHGRACMGLPQAGIILPDHPQELFFQRRQRWIFARCAFPLSLQHGMKLCMSTYIRTGTWQKPGMIQATFTIEKTTLHKSRYIWLFLPAENLPLAPC